MFKKILVAILSFFILQGCCDEVKKKYYQITQINPTIAKGIDSNQAPCAGDNYFPADTLWIEIGSQAEFVASNSLRKNWNLIPTAKARSKCPHEGEKGLKHHLKAIEIKLKSDTTYNITKDVVLQGFGWKSVSRWLELSPERFPNCIQIRKFNTKDTLFTASLKFTFENGSVLQSKTDTFTWKMG